MAQYLYLGSYGESQRVSRPKVFIYNVEKQTFQGLETIPDFYSAGELSWKVDGSGIVAKLLSLTIINSCDTSIIIVFS